MGYFGAPDGVIDDADVRPLRNCGLGRVLRHREGNVLAAELLFGQPLRAGETWLFEYEVRQHAVTTDLAHNFRRPEGHHVLEIRFHPDELPASVHGYYRTGLFGDLQRVTDLTLNNHHSVHLATEGMAAGVIGISWRWELRRSRS